MTSWRDSEESFQDTNRHRGSYRNYTCRLPVNVWELRRPVAEILKCKISYVKDLWLVHVFRMIYHNQERYFLLTFKTTDLFTHHCRIQPLIIFSMGLCSNLILFAWKHSHVLSWEQKRSGLTPLISSLSANEGKKQRL